MKETRPLLTVTIEAVATDDLFQPLTRGPAKGTEPDRRTVLSLKCLCLISPQCLPLANRVPSAFSANLTETVWLGGLT